jgi:hypothetical protein
MMHVYKGRTGYCRVPGTAWVCTIHCTVLYVPYGMYRVLYTIVSYVVMHLIIVYHNTTHIKKVNANQ